VRGNRVDAVPLAREHGAVLKICPLCKRTWSGGRDCPRCGEGHPLIDVAEPTGRRVFLRDRELASAIRGYYGARTGMLVAFWGILVGLVLSIALARKAMVAHSPLLWALAAIAALAPVLVAVVVGDRIVRRFSKGCVGRAPGPQDIRIGGRDSARGELLGFGQR
jgi:hypothetical protein